MADKVDEEKKLAASSLPVTKASEKTTKKAPPLPAVQLVCLWALLTAAIMLGSIVLAAHVHQLPSWLPKGTELTDAEAAEVCAIIQWMLWCSATQAAAAALALLLPARHRWSRRALAYVALAATATSHLMFARMATLGVTTDDLGDIFWLVLGTVDMSFFAVGDIICFLALLGRGAYANAPAC